MGILVGTALTVIIPEGIETLYNSVGSHTQHHLHPRAIDIRGLHSDIPVVLHRGEPVVQGNSLSEPELPVTIPRLIPKSADETLDQDTHEEDATESTGEEEADDQAALHAWVGVALISGFVLMYLIDKLPEFAAPTKPKRPTHHISLDNLGGPALRRSASPNTNAGLLEPEASSRNHSIATTLGLVIHAVADGIALGASGSNASLGFIIFFALLVHKAPASFGLTSVLLKQGLSNRLARAHLLVFSLAAPVGAVLTFILVHAFGSGPEIDESAIRWRTGVVLLFSAGTFLYVQSSSISGMIDDLLTDTPGMWPCTRCMKMPRRRRRMRATAMVMRIPATARIDGAAR